MRLLKSKILSMSIRIAVICGDHPRNIFLAKNIFNEFGLVGVILQKREDLVPRKIKFTTNNDRENYQRHFSNRKLYEEKYFGEARVDFITNLLVLRRKQDLSSYETVKFVKSLAADIIFVFGVGIIREPLLSNLPRNTINVHSGLTPKYKGTACNFWPFYFLEPNWAGITFHLLIKKLDMGNVIHQVQPKLEYGDTIHEVACKSVILACQEIKKVIYKLNQSPTLEGRLPISSGKLFKKNDFRPEHLRIIYNLFNDDIVDHYLNASISPVDPVLINIENF